MRIFSIYVGITILVHLFIFSSDVLSHESHESELSLQRIIIKFQPDSPLSTQAQELFESGTPFSEVTGDYYLDELIARFGVQDVEKLAKDPRSREEIMAKYPERAKRRPKDSSLSPSPLLGVFRLKVNISVSDDIQMICDEFAQSPHVLYAQPDHVMSIHAP